MDRPRTWTCRKNSSRCLLLPPFGRRTRSRPSSRRERRSARFERWRERRIYRLTDRLERRRERLADSPGAPDAGAVIGAGCWTRLRHRWLAGSERLEVLEELLLDPLEPVPPPPLRALGTLPGAGVPGGAVAAAGVSLTLAFAMVVMLPLEDTARIDSGPAPIVLPPGTGLDIGPTREAPAPTSAAITWEGYANGDLGYRFSYPSDWDVEVSSQATVLSDTADQVVVTFLASPTGSPRDGVGSAPRADHRTVQWLRDGRDGNSTNRARIRLDLRGRDGARCGRDLDPLPHHHHQGPRREPRDRGSVPVEADAGRPGRGRASDRVVPA